MLSRSACSLGGFRPGNGREGVNGGRKMRLLVRHQEGAVNKGLPAGPNCRLPRQLPAFPWSWRVGTARSQCRSARRGNHRNCSPGGCTVGRSCPPRPGQSSAAAFCHTADNETSGSGLHCGVRAPIGFAVIKGTGRASSNTSRLLIGVGFMATCFGSRQV